MLQDQNPQPTSGVVTVPGAGDQEVTFILIPAGGPHEGQRMAPYTHQAQPATSDGESAVSMGATTQSLEETPVGDEEPAGLRSDTEPPSLDTEVQVEERPEDPVQPPGHPSLEVQDISDQAEPNEGKHIQRVLNLLTGVNNGILVRQAAVPANIKVSRKDLLRLPDNPYGDAHGMEVQAPTLDQGHDEDENNLPSAPPQPLVDQAF